MSIPTEYKNINIQNNNEKKSLLNKHTYIDIESQKIENSKVYTCYDEFKSHETICGKIGFIFTMIVAGLFYTILYLLPILAYIGCFAFFIFLLHHNKI